MTLASDDFQGSDKLSSTAQRMLALRDRVLEEWGRRLRESVKEATLLPQPILVNTLPSFYENLAQAISPDYPRLSREDTSTVAEEHGGERARLTQYNAQAVISEYQLLRATLFDVLMEEGVRLDNRECHVINAAIDGAIRDSVNAFEVAQAALRERFVAALTHDLRNPLMAAYASAELIRLSANAADAPRHAERILEHLNRMDGMLRELLDVVVFHTGERLRLHISQFDMASVVREVAEQFDALCSQRIELELTSVVGWWDRDAIKRAVENLVGNALKYGSRETPIRIQIVSYYERIALSVHNDGEPVPPEQMPTVFKAFRRSHAAREGDVLGWGIGLPYVRSVAESHGGSVGMDSSLERGTTVTIDMPLDARPFRDAPTL